MVTILSGQSAEEFHRCIHDNDVQALVRLPGIGKKTAERLIIEMRDRLPNMAESSGSGQTVSVNVAANNPGQEAISALCALGYKPQDASKMVQAIPQQDKTCEEIIRMALQGTVAK